MFSSCYSVDAVEPPSPFAPEDFDGAGTVFTNGNTVLAGYQKEDRSPSINGIGGHRKGAETYLQTALRETVEELFGLDDVPVTLIQTLGQTLKTSRVHKSGSYVLVIYTFADLETLLKVVERAVRRSPLYRVFPKTLSSLIIDRDPNVNPRPEIIHLCILPVVKGCFVDSQLLEDMEIIKPELAATRMMISV